MGKGLRVAWGAIVVVAGLSAAVGHAQQNQGGRQGGGGRGAQPAAPPSIPADAVR